MFYVVDYIKRYGYPLNYNISRGEIFSIVKIKDNAKLADKQKETLKFDINHKISEDDIVDQISPGCYQNKGY